MSKMKAIIWDGENYPEGISYGEFEIPAPKKNWVQFQAKAVGICGSDIHAICGHTRHIMKDENFPAILGHENAGVVTMVGEGVTEFKPGDRVAVEPISGCIDYKEGCSMCRSGKYQLCKEGMNIIGMPITRMLPGGYGEFSCVHKSHLYLLPDDILFEEAALLDILAVNVHAYNLGMPSIDMSIAVVGSGIVGLEMIQILYAAGIRNIIAVAKYKFQAELAERLGANHVVLLDNNTNAIEEVMHLTKGRGVDQAYECVGGNTDAVSESMYMCASGGRVIMLGGSSKPRPIDMQEMVLKEAAIIASNSYAMFNGKNEFKTALDMLVNKQVCHKCLITGRYHFEDYKAAFDSMLIKEKGNTIKSVFVRE